MRQVAPIPYSDFERYLEQDKVAEVAVSDNYIQGKLKEPLADGKQEFVTTRVEPDFAQQLQEHGVTFTGQIESTFFSDLMSWVIPAVVFVGIWRFAMRRVAVVMGRAIVSPDYVPGQTALRSTRGGAPIPLAPRSPAPPRRAAGCCSSSSSPWHTRRRT